MVVLFNHACQPRVLSGWLLRRERGDNFFKARIATQGIQSGSTASGFVEGKKNPQPSLRGDLACKIYR